MAIKKVAEMVVMRNPDGSATGESVARVRGLLVHLVTRYDAAEEARELKRRHGRVNIYRLGLLLQMVDRICDDVAAGASLARALYDNANDRLLTSFEKRCGLPVSFGGGAHDTGRPI
jgi:hypothetical protein